MAIPTLARRSFLSGSAIVAAGIAAPTARASVAGDAFTYEITRSEAEWRAMLSDVEYGILREGGTEAQRSSPFWDNRQGGVYSCKGCHLENFTSRWQTYPGPGWVFFRQAVANSVLTAVDDSNPYSGEVSNEPLPDILALIEVHCRRCGSHIGHILSANQAALYCLNGAALHFAVDEV